MGGIRGDATSTYIRGCWLRSMLEILWDNWLLTIGACALHAYYRLLLVSLSTT